MSERELLRECQKIAIHYIAVSSREPTEREHHILMDISAALAAPAHAAPGVKLFDNLLNPKPPSVSPQAPSAVELLEIAAFLGPAPDGVMPDALQEQGGSYGLRSGLGGETSGGNAASQDNEDMQVRSPNQGERLSHSQADMRSVDCGPTAEGADWVWWEKSDGYSAIGPRNKGSVAVIETEAAQAICKALSAAPRPDAGEELVERLRALVADIRGDVTGCGTLEEYHNIGMTHDGWMDLVAALRGRARLSSRRGKR